jgi:3-oxoacyl-[acyl-carrier protein] reductase
MPIGTNLADSGAAKESKRVAVVSGAGSGIGASTALRLAMNGYDLALIGRRETKLMATRNCINPGPDTVCSIHVADLTDADAVHAAA